VTGLGTHGGSPWGMICFRNFSISPASLAASQLGVMRVPR
jgi:hypothetical protein